MPTRRQPSQTRPLRKTRHNTGNAKTDQALQQIQDDVDESVRGILKGAMVESRVIEGVSITAGTPTIVDHGLGRPFRGWKVSRPKAAAHVFETASQPGPERYIELDADADVTFDLVVF